MEEETKEKMTDEELENIDWGSDDQWRFYGNSLPESHRDSGYKNAAYALGELVDNSIQAGAENVEVIMFEKWGRVGTRQMWNVNEVGILDDGSGMDPMLQRASILFQSGSTQLDLPEALRTSKWGNSELGYCKPPSPKRGGWRSTWTNGGQKTPLLLT